MIQVFEQDPSKVPLEDSFQIPSKVFFFFGTGYNFLSTSFFTGFFQGFSVGIGSFSGCLKDPSKVPLLLLKFPLMRQVFEQDPSKVPLEDTFQIPLKVFFFFGTGSSPQASLQDSSKVFLLV